MALEQFRKWYGSRHDYQRRWQEKTGQKIVGYFCTYTPEEIFYAFDILPVRLMGSHELQNVTDPHIFSMFCPYCRDVLAQGLQGRYDYLDGIFISQSCIHLRQAFSSWEIHKNPGWSHYLPMPNHVQSPRAIPFLTGEYKLLVQKLKKLTGKTITSEDLEKGITVKNQVRQTLKQIYALRQQEDPPLSGADAMVIACSAFFVDPKEWLPEAGKALEYLKAHTSQRPTGKRIILVGSENDDLSFIEMVEDLGNTGGTRATVVVEEHCATTRNFWNETEPNSRDPLTAIAQRYCSRTPCPSKDWPARTRMDRIQKFAKDFRCDGAIIVQQKFCDPHQSDLPFVKQALESIGIPSCFFEFDVANPVGAFSLRVERFLESLEDKFIPQEQYG